MGVDDGRLLLICEQMGDGVARRDELRQTDHEVLIHQLFFQQQQQHPVSLHRQEVQQTAAFTFQHSGLWLLMPKCSTSSELFYNVRIQQSLPVKTFLCTALYSVIIISKNSFCTALYTVITLQNYIQQVSYQSMTLKATIGYFASSACLWLRKSYLTHTVWLNVHTLTPALVYAWAMSALKDARSQGLLLARLLDTILWTR